MMITTDNDYEIVNATLKNISVHPAGAYLQYSVPGKLVDTDYAKYLEIEKFLLRNNLMQPYGASGRVILTETGESVLYDYHGDVRMYLNAVALKKSKSEKSVIKNKKREKLMLLVAIMTLISSIVFGIIMLLK